MSSSLQYIALLVRPQRGTHEHRPYRESVQQEQGQPQAEGERMDQRIWNNGPKGHEYQSVDKFVIIATEYQEFRYTLISMSLHSTQCTYVKYNYIYSFYSKCISFH